MVKFGRNNYVF